MNLAALITYIYIHLALYVITSFVLYLVLSNIVHLLNFDSTQEIIHMLFMNAVHKSVLIHVVVHWVVVASQVVCYETGA